MREELVHGDSLPRDGVQGGAREGGGTVVRGDEGDGDHKGVQGLRERLFGTGPSFLRFFWRCSFLRFFGMFSSSS